MLIKRALTLIAGIVSLSVARAAPLDQPPLQYEGISAATTLAGLKARFPEQVAMVADNPTPGRHPISATLRFAPGHMLGLASFLDYYEVADEDRVIRLFFAGPGSAPPGDEISLSCRTLLDPLRSAFGREPNVEQSDEENFHHIKHIWTRGRQTMTLDCGNLPKDPPIVDRLYFECRGVCR